MIDEVHARVNRGLGRFRVYPEYRESGVEWLGEIPEGWDVVPLKTASGLQTGLTLGQRGGGANLVTRPYLRVANVQDGYLDLSDLAEIAVPSTSVGRYELRDLDVLVTEGGDFDKLGRGYVWNAQIKGCLHQNHVFAVRPDPSALSPQFLALVTTSAYGRAYFTATSKQSTNLASTNSTKLRRFPIPLPEVNEQRAIVAFLDQETAKIDALVEKKERLIELLKEKRTALITHAVTKGLDPDAPMKDSGVEWLGEIPEGWEVLQLRRVVAKFVDYRGKTPRKTESGVPLVTAKNVRDGAIDFARSEEFIPDVLYEEWMVRGFPALGDVLVTTEAPLGETAQISDPKIALAQRIILLKANESRMESDYLKWHFMGGAGQAELSTRATGSTALGIKASHLKATLVSVPPLHEQVELAKFLGSETERFRVLEGTVRIAIEHLKEYRTALISAAVTGKIDVRNEVDAA